jgi:putative pyoverdin transport system ATP-binding/permease protein
MKLISYLFRHSWRAMVLVTICAALAGLASTALVAVLSKAVVGKGDNTWLGFAFFIACIAYVTAKSLSEVGLLKVTQRTVLKLRMVLSRNLIGTSHRDLDRIGRDELMVIMTRDIDTFSATFQVIPRGLSNAVIIIAGLAYVAVLSWQFLLVMVVCMTLCVGSYLIAERKPLALLAQARGQAQSLQRCTRDIIDGSRELKLSKTRRDTFVNQVLYGEAERYLALYTRGMAMYTWFGNLGNILFYQGIAVLLFIVPAWMATDRPLLIQVTLVTLYIIKPLSELINLLPMVRQAEIAFGRVQQLRHRLDEEPSILADPDPFSEHLQQLEFRDVRYRYDQDSKFAFEVGPFSLRLMPGELLFIVGGNGSGKTTLAMLLLGLIEPDAGDILLNGVAVSEANRENYRQRFDAIFSDTHLFEKLPIAKNGNELERGNGYLRRFMVPDHVTLDTGVFSTVKLSTGQRKRLALVSLALEDRPIFVFDEVAADQDPEFKRFFYRSILPELKDQGKMIIVITHDDTYFDCADRILSLEDGHFRDLPSLVSAN